MKAEASEPDPAADVETDPAGRDDTAGGDVGGGHSPDREPVPPVDVGHRHRGVHDAGEVGHVGDLLGGLILSAFTSSASLAKIRPGPRIPLRPGSPT